MSAKATEQRHESAVGLDARPLADVAEILAEAQAEAAQATLPARLSIAAGGEAMARTIAAGGTLHYVAAGSSGLMAAADAMELGGTFSIPPKQIRIHMAGGIPHDAEMPGDTEDATDTLEAELAELNAVDTVIAVSASGTTPYTLAALNLARTAEATVIGIANNAGSPLLEEANISVCLETPPEVLSGSTRMGAGTAQKIALNMMSTLMAVKLGHVHDGLMVNLRADNIKLRERAKAIVKTVAGCDDDSASTALRRTGGDVKAAILCASGAPSAEAAQSLLEETGGHLREALKKLT
ncbi:N-acetylmuramic acid 6-phosphate etherase [Shimia isoporae]|uniref:N-acetylmuramic acid 6-phosphate etherase n=1 Tax=Shimia isoporae TaxID=647720 RepID=A0A4R1N3I6_9RHOB|nr:N-acetylmuramic acid 6-phosphate etherase [Shimia isoporae]TCL01176.1 N-acetylmuramic acid 6-phosphate etherase [Shimia isoporae]